MCCVIPCAMLLYCLGVLFSLVTVCCYVIRAMIRWGWDTLFLCLLHYFVCFDTTTVGNDTNIMPTNFMYFCWYIRHVSLLQNHNSANHTSYCLVTWNVIIHFIWRVHLINVKGNCMKLLNTIYILTVINLYLRISKLWKYP